MSWARTMEIDCPGGSAISLDTGVIINLDHCEKCEGRVDHIDVYTDISFERVQSLPNRTLIVLGPCGHRPKHFAVRMVENQWASMTAALWAIDDPDMEEFDG